MSGQMSTVDDLSWGGVVVLAIICGIAISYLAGEVIAGFAIPLPRRTDPADRLVWDVLDEARRILDEGDGAAG